MAKRSAFKAEVVKLVVVCTVLIGIVYSASFGISHRIEAKVVDDVTAKGCVLIEAETGKVLFEKNMNDRLPMASTTKIMTTLLTLEAGELDEYFRVDNDAINVEGSSMGLVENDMVSLRMLAYGMMLPSGNDAANVAALKVGGSSEAFLQMMNQRAADIGLSNTNFETPSGLDSENHYSSAYDMAKLTAVALENPVFAEICSQEQAQLSFGNPPFDRWLSNTNKLLTRYDGCIGVKTGFTDNAKRCLVTAAERDGIKLICVTLNDPNDWQNHADLYDYGFSVVKRYRVSDEVSLPELEVIGGETGVILPVIDTEKELSLTDDDYKNLTQKVNLPPFIYAPIVKGDLIGSIEYYLGTERVYSLPILADVDIKRLEEEKNIFEKFFTLFESSKTIGS